jgi:hypothetical protein
MSLSCFPPALLAVPKKILQQLLPHELVDSQAIPLGDLITHLLQSTSLDIMIPEVFGYFSVLYITVC